MAEVILPFGGPIDFFTASNLIKCPRPTTYGAHQFGWRVALSGHVFSGSIVHQMFYIVKLA